MSECNKDGDMHKTTFSLPEELYERMMKYLSRYGKTRGRMAIFIQDAIREKLDRILEAKDHSETS